MTVVPKPDRWHGKLHLAYARDGDRTILTRNEGVAPLKVQRSFYPEDPQICHNIIAHTAGGMVRGDILEYWFDTASDAAATVSTAAAGKIYGSGDPAKVAVQNYRMKVAAGGYLEWMPQETIVFNGAHYEQSLDIELAADAVWLGMELVRFGRTARGERFTQGKWRSATTVSRDGKPLWIDRQQISPSLLTPEYSLSSVNSLANKATIGTLAFVGTVVDGDLVNAARDAFTDDRTEIGVTRLAAGLLCRYRGNSTTAARQWFHRIWQLCRRWQNLHPPDYPRHWQ
jgi:urease accessory protein